MGMHVVEGKLRYSLGKQVTLLSASPGIKGLLGFDAEEFIQGRVRLEDRIHPGDADIMERLFSPESEENEGRCNLRIRHADGRIRCMRVRHRREPGRSGKHAEIELLIEDAKSLYRAEEQPACLTNDGPMMNDVSEALYFKNRDHVFTAANRAALQIFAENGAAADGLAGKTSYDIFPEEYADAYYALEKKVLQGSSMASASQPLPVRDKKRMVDNVKYPVKNAEGEVIGLFGVSHDITDRVEMIEKLRRSEQQLQEAQQIAGLGSYILDMATGRWTSSDVLDAVLGIGREYDRTVEGWLALVHPDDRPMMTFHYKDEVFGKGRPFNKEYRIIRVSDGAVRWMHGLGRLEFDSNHRPVKMLGTIRDITDHKESELALRESQKLLELFIEHAPVAIAMFDREMRYLKVSQKWARDHGLKAQDLIGRSHYEIIPDIPERWKETHRRGLRGELQHSEEDRFDRADGTVQWIRWEILPWRAADGTIGGIIMFYEDITERRQTHAALRESKEQLELFIAHAPAAMAMFDREMRYLVVSERWLEDYGLKGREIIGHSHYEVIPDLPERWKEAHRRGLAGETLRADEDPYEHADGTVQWIRWEIVPWRAGDGTIGGIILFAEDITQFREIEERLRLAASMFTHAQEGIMITDPTGRILEVNDMFTRITGYTHAEALGKEPRLFGSSLHSKEFYANLWHSLQKEGQWTGEIWNRHKNGELFAVSETIRAVRDPEGNLIQYVSLFSDITQLKKHAQQLEHLAHYDVLTELPNRVLLADRLRQAMVTAKRRKQLLAVAYLDLDRFKAINDKHGSNVGDRLLNTAAFNMKCALREGDTLARLGGDEFVAVILDLDDAAAGMPVLEQLRRAAAEPVQVENLSLSISASIGVTFYPQSEEADPDQLMRQADQAMYQAKLAGGNRYHIYNPDHDLTVRGRHENLERIQRALAERELVLYYQPKVNMRTGKVDGVEALIRWQHPERGLLPPGVFLPVVEDHPLAIEIGEWVIDEVLTQMESWQHDELQMPVSVNVSAIQLQQPDFVNRLTNQLAAHPTITPFNLQIEVLETSALRDIVQTSQVLHACHRIGISFALDDFGTGYSSLTYLKRLPANVLKIDQSFVSDMLDDPENLNILEGILSLATAFHRQVIAEGVETVEHGLMLLYLGCELAQGYGIARPMQADEVVRWVNTWRPDPRWSNVPRIHAGNKALLAACVEIGAWVTALESFLMGGRHTPPAIDQEQCRFNKWLEAERAAGRGNDPGCVKVEGIHKHLHALSAEMLQTHAQNGNAEGVGRLQELHGIYDELLAQLAQFEEEL